MKAVEKIKIDTREEYELAKNFRHLFLDRNNEPLKDLWFDIDPKLRKELQAEMFSTDEKFYHYAYSISTPICEECGCPLPTYSATYVSHIQSRGAFPERRADLRNFNLLCPRHHEMWETGDRNKMRIYAKNLKIIDRLNKDYGDKDN